MFLVVPPAQPHTVDTAQNDKNGKAESSKEEDGTLVGPLVLGILTGDATHAAQGGLSLPQTFLSLSLSSLGSLYGTVGHVCFWHAFGKKFSFFQASLFKLCHHMTL